MADKDKVRRSWEEYGITKKRYRELKELCTVPAMETIVEMACIQTCPMIWEWLAESILNTKSYELVEYDRRLGRIPCGRSDFYGFRRRAYATINEYLRRTTR